MKFNRFLTVSLYGNNTLMKLDKVFRILAAALLPALFAATVPAGPVRAAGEVISLSSNQGAIGQVITITGSGFTGNTTPRYGVNILFGKYPDASGAAVMDYSLNIYERLQVWELRSDGTFETTFTIPSRLTGGNIKEEVARGSYYVYLTYFYPTTTPGVPSINGAAIIQMTPFNVVVGAITISPDNGAVGSEVNINGTYFGVTEGITVRYDSLEANFSGNGLTSSSGAFGPTKITIPPGIAGQHTITVSGNNSGTIAQATFTVAPKLTIVPTSGSAGTLINVSGSGFGRQLDATSAFGGDPLTPTRTDVYGSFAFNFGALKKAEGNYDIVVTDGGGNSDKASFRLTVAKFDLRPNTGTA
ncbi:MAG: IPT/TIG domain-containing protein, partial [Chloroflexota bacterium]